MSLIDNIKKRGLSDILNPKKWWVYVISMLREWLLGSPFEQVARAEQTVYRIHKCRDCFQDGSCKVCGCPTPESMLEPDNWCEGGKWGEMLSYKEWEEFKKENQLTIKPVYDA